MDRRIKDYLAERRQEKCPDRVYEQVKATRPQSKSTAASTQFIPWLATSVALITLFISVIPSWRPTPAITQPRTQQAEDSEKTLREAYASISLIGHTLLAAGQRSGQIVIEETLPSLKDGYENTKQTLRNTYESN